MNNSNNNNLSFISYNNSMNINNSNELFHIIIKN